MGSNRTPDGELKETNGELQAAGWGVVAQRTVQNKAVNTEARLLLLSRGSFVYLGRVGKWIFDSKIISKHSYLIVGKLSF